MICFRTALTVLAPEFDISQAARNISVPRIHFLTGEGRSLQATLGRHIRPAKGKRRRELVKSRNSRQKPEAVLEDLASISPIPASIIIWHGWPSNPSPATIEHAAMPRP